MTLDEAIAAQFRLVDIAQRVMGSDEVFAKDYGQVRELATVGFGGGGRPRATARVEQVLARYFECEDAVLVHGAGSGAIRTMLNASAAPGRGSSSTTAAAQDDAPGDAAHGARPLAYADYNDAAALRAEPARQPAGHGLYSSTCRSNSAMATTSPATIQLIRAVAPQPVRIVVDDNYAGMRAARIGVQLGRTPPRCRSSSCSRPTRSAWC